jgi:hypothetical protein
MVGSRETFNVKISVTVAEDLILLALLVVFAKLLLISQIAIKNPIQSQSALLTHNVLPSTQNAPGVFAQTESASNYSWPAWIAVLLLLDLMVRLVMLKKSALKVNLSVLMMIIFRWVPCAVKL